MKAEKWNGHEIRFVEKDGEWWAVGVDVARALEYVNPSKAVVDHCKGISKLGIPSGRGVQETSVISEIDIYNLIFKAADQNRNQTIKAIAEDFKDWVFGILKTLRQSSGLEGFEVFRMLDKEHQREAMKKLRDSLHKPVRVDFIKGNIIANKAVSNKYGCPRMVRKADMTPEMLIDRQGLLDDTVELMKVKEKFRLELSVSDQIYSLAMDTKRDHVS